MKIADKKDIELISSDMAYSSEEVDDTSWIAVYDEDTYDTAQTFKDSISKKIKDIEAYFKPRKQRAKAVHSDWVQAEKDALKPFSAERASIQAKQNAYLAKKEKDRVAAEAKVIAAAPEGAPVHIPPAPKVRGGRVTYSGEITDINTFLQWAIKEGTVENFIDLKKAPINALANTIKGTEKTIPGLKVVKNVSAL